MTVNDLPVPWGEYYYWIAEKLLHDNKEGALPDWKAVQTDGMTYDESLRSYAGDTMTYFLVLESMAAGMDVELSADDRAALEETWQNAVAQSGGEAAMLAYLDSVFLTRDSYAHFKSVDILQQKLFAHMYGENGGKLSDGDVLEYAGSQGYMHAKHILFRTVDEEGEAIPEAEKAEMLAQAENTLAALRENSGVQEEKFDELMEERSGDTGLPYYPDGYTFLPG
jgi:hypothetical protein